MFQKALKFLTFLYTVTLSLGLACSAFAQNEPIPGAADAARQSVSPERFLRPAAEQDLGLNGTARIEMQAPEGAEIVKFTLLSLEIRGGTAFSPAELRVFYKGLLGREIALSVLWEIAEDITNYYRQQGYFLSRAFVPLQEIENGTVRLRVLEGYIGEIELPEEYRGLEIINNILQPLREEKPLSIATLESVILRVQDLPGYNVRAVLDKDDDGPEGSVRLVLIEKEETSRGSIVFNNYGSRFTGPHRTGFAYETSLVPRHQTVISGLVSIPGARELWSLEIEHSYALSGDLRLEGSIGRTVSDPGFTLSQNDVESRYSQWQIGLRWNPVRQRRENLIFGIDFQGQNLKTDVLGAAFTRDQIRTLRANAAYQSPDALDGLNRLDVELSRGIDGLGASNENEGNLSRAAAEPDYTKVEVSWQRQEIVEQNWLMTTLLEGQYASKPLYSSEEFGYGGAYLGRGYESSEIIGDQGIAGSIEMRYLDMDPVEGINLQPYGFYEIGKIWNDDAGQIKDFSAASAGLGIEMRHRSGIAADLTLAQPLTKSVDTPVYGNNGKNPRLYFELSYGF